MVPFHETGLGADFWGKRDIYKHICVNLSFKMLGLRVLEGIV